VKRGLQLAAASFFGLFAAALYAALDFALLDSLGPGPGFFPLGLAIVGAALSVLLLFEVSGAAADGGEAILPDAAAMPRLAATLAALAAAGLLLEPLGYRLTTLLFIAGLLLVLGVRSPLALALCALGGSFGVFHVFHAWLKVPLPIGRLGI
jgi:putative tricarboxylic transport membrane protein